MKAFAPVLGAAAKGKRMVCFSHAASSAIVAALTGQSLADVGKFAPCGVFHLKKAAEEGKCTGVFRCKTHIATLARCVRVRVCLRSCVQVRVRVCVGTIITMCVALTINPPFFLVKKQQC